MKYKVIKSFCGIKKGSLMDLPDSLAKPLLADKHIKKASASDKEEIEEDDIPEVDSKTTE